MAGGGVDVEGGAKGAGAGGEIVETVAPGDGGGVEAAAVVADLEPETMFVEGGENQIEAGGGAVAEGVADGFADDLKQVRADGVGEGRQAGIEVNVTFAKAADVDVVEDRLDGGGETLLLEGVGGEAADGAPGFADGGVEGGFGAIHEPRGLGRIGGRGRELLGGGFEDETGGVERLDQAVVKIAPEADFVLQGVVGEKLLEMEVLFAAVAGLAFVVEFEALGVGGAGEAFEAAHFGAGGGGVDGGRVRGDPGRHHRDGDEAGEAEAGEGEQAALGSHMVGAQGLLDRVLVEEGGLEEVTLERALAVPFLQKQRARARGEGAEGEDEDGEAEEVAHAGSGGGRSGKSPAGSSLGMLRAGKGRFKTFDKRGGLAFVRRSTA